METDEFLEQYKNDTSKTTVLDIVYGELVEYCREHDIDEDAVSTPQLEAAASQIVKQNNF